MHMRMRQAGDAHPQGRRGTGLGKSGGFTEPEQEQGNYNGQETGHGGTGKK
ncbi:MAG: hypothetical protein NVS3B25_09490 [Hymenobacter sp.]